MWFCLNRRLHFLLGHANCHYAVIGLSARRKSHAPHLAGVSATILESCTKHARSDDVTVELRTVTRLSAYDWNTDLIQDAIVPCTCVMIHHDVRWGMRICQHHSSAFSILHVSFSHACWYDSSFDECARFGVLINVQAM